MTVLLLVIALLLVAVIVGILIYQWGWMSGFNEACRTWREDG